jgi:hypothetical protein
VTPRKPLQHLVLALSAVALAVTAGTVPAQTAAARTARGSATDATYYNDASQNAADPYVLWDEKSGYYYAYSTDGAAKGWRFGIYRSPDLATWERMPGGALPAADPKQWGHDWFWAPEVYLNESTGKYFLFYAARENTHVADDFGYADFAEASRIGVAVSDSPAGPFHNISNRPIDYHPYDPAYHDVNLIMDATQKKPPATEAEGETAPLGTYLPSIDPDVFFDDGHAYLYYSRNAYRNWVWDDDLGKYVEESNIYAVELTTDWWDDPAGATMPTITPDYAGANEGPGGPPGPRRDGFVRILDYGHDKQAWENAHVDDYATTGGQKKDRRWAEGSTTFRRMVDTDGDGTREPVYYLLYSANNFENASYGVGYATATSPLGPWTKYAGNPVLHQDPTLPMYSTGHGSLAVSPDGSETYYVHHGRPTPTTARKLYTERMFLDGSPDDKGYPTLSMDQTTGDRPVPRGVAPYTMSVTADRTAPGTVHLRWAVRSAPGAAQPLGNPLNRVQVDLDRAGSVTPDADGAGATVSVERAAIVTLTYQRMRADGSYVDVHQGIGASRETVGRQVVIDAR